MRFRWSYEDERGFLTHKDAFIVLEKMVDRYKKPLFTFNVNGQWNIRIKSTDSSGTLININIVNVTYQMVNYTTGMAMSSIQPQIITSDRFKSTGVF
jgi:hypothetical protein